MPPVTGSGWRVGAITAVLVTRLLVFSSAGAAQGVSAPAARPPNVVIVFIDDMGFADPSSFGNTRVHTVNIDRLAREGTRFTQFYSNSPICSPSRVAITTGTYPSRWDIHSFLNSRARNRERGMADFLDPAAPTLARALKGSGYATAHFGKWHMGGGRDVGDAPLPQAYGFDESLTSFEGLGDRYLWRDALNEQSAKLGRGEIRWAEKHEMTRIYVDRAIEFMQRNRNRPFYLNLWPNDVHDEFWPRPGTEETYRAIGRSEEERKFFAVLEEMDRQLGRFFGEMSRLGLERETIVVFTSDNGPTDWPRYYRAGVAPPGSSGPFRGRKWSLYEGGIRMPLIVRWPGHIPAGLVDDSTVFSAIDLVPSLAALAGTRFRPDTRLDGQDVSGALLGRGGRRDGPLYWYFPNDILPGDRSFLTPTLAVREGRWKLLVEKDGSGARLYDLERDPAEARDLAGRHPAIVRGLIQKVVTWYESL